nr:rhodanese-like domain-containing protein [Stappia albiluteola]
MTGSKFSNLDNDGLKEKLSQGATVVDIRRPDEWKATGVIEGSKLLTFFDAQGQVNPTFFDDLSALAGKDDEIVLICQQGARSLVVSRFLSERAGYSKIRNVSAGIGKWIADGNPVTQAQAPDGCWLC